MKRARPKRTDGSVAKSGPVPAITPERLEYLERLALLGLTDREICYALDVKEKTFEQWKRVYPSIRDTLKRGRIEAVTKVGVALFRAATGWSHPDTHIIAVRGKVKKIPIIKHYPPSNAAMMFFLKNKTRHFEQPWTDIMKHEVTGKAGQNIQFDHHLDLSGLTTEELTLLNKLAPKLNVASKGIVEDIDFEDMNDKRRLDAAKD